MPPPPPRPPVALMDELVEEVLHRLPPDDPAHLLRAALVCKRWCRLVSNPRFRRRFREFHGGTPPLLGFLYHRGFSTRFMPTTAASSSFRPRYAIDGRRGCAIDARHGRVLLYCSDLFVSNPVTGDERRLPMPRFPEPYNFWGAALLCAAPGCDHLDCAAGGLFLVVFVGTDLVCGG